MTKIKRYVEDIDEELCGAKDYAEMCIELKSEGNSTWANRFKEMANDELKHANYIHEWAVQEIQRLNEVFKPTQEMEESWEKSHKEYVEKTAWIKQMLLM